MKGKSKLTIYPRLQNKTEKRESPALPKHNCSRAQISFRRGHGCCSHGFGTQLVLPAIRRKKIPALLQTAFVSFHFTSSLCSDERKPFATRLGHWIPVIFSVSFPLTIPSPFYPPSQLAWEGGDTCMSLSCALQVTYYKHFSLSQTVPMISLGCPHISGKLAKVLSETFCMSLITQKAQSSME